MLQLYPLLPLISQNIRLFQQVLSEMIDLPDGQLHQIQNPNIMVLIWDFTNHTTSCSSVTDDQTGFVSTPNDKFQFPVPLAKEIICLPFLTLVDGFEDTYRTSYKFPNVNEHKRLVALLNSLTRHSSD